MTDPVGRVEGKYFTSPGNKTAHPSVTKVLDCLSKEALAPGAVKECAHYLFNHPDAANVRDGQALTGRLIRHYKGVWEAKRDRGSFMHAVNEAWVAGNTVEVPEDCAGYADALEAFWTDWKPEWVHVERTVVYDHPEVGYGGTFDFIANLAGRDKLGDIKTGKNIYSEVLWQLAAYRYAQAMAVYDEIGQFTCTEPMPEVDGCVVLHLHDDGTYTLLDVNVTRQHFDEFLALRRAWAAWDRGERIKKVGKPLAVPQREGSAA